MDNKIFTENLRGFEIKFKTKPGVFSKAGLDMGLRLLIENMEIKDGTMVADLGCGVGVIGFVAAKLNPQGHVHLLDDHLRSIEVARENLELNKLKNVEIYLSDLFQEVGERTYHVIVSNPPFNLGNEFLEEVASETYKHLKPQGKLFWVVQNHLKPVAKRLFEKYFGNFIAVDQGREHTVVKALKQN